MIQVFEQPFHGIQFSIPDEGYYETQDGLSWGVNPACVHEWNAGGSEIKLQISRREIPTLPTEPLPQLEQSLFQLLPFPPAAITCLACPKSSPRRSALATSETRRATSTTWACSPSGPSISRRELKLRELAQLSSVDHAYIYRLESGDKESPSEEVLSKLIKPLRAGKREADMLRYLAEHTETDPELVKQVIADETITYEIFTAVAGDDEDELGLKELDRILRWPTKNRRR